MIEPSPDPIDLAALIRVCMGLEPLAHKLLGQLLLQAPGWREAIQQAAAARDPEQIRFICHTLRGAAATMQARRLEHAASQLGAQIRANPSTDLLEAIRETEAAISATQAFAAAQLE